MKACILFLIAAFQYSCYSAGKGKIIINDWQKRKEKNYTLYFPKEEKSHIGEYKILISSGYSEVEKFFGEAFKQKFEVFIYPARSSLDSAWQKNWNMPDFKSECWMVASGVAQRVDILSLNKWSTEACEHSTDDKANTQKLITHELIHVFHGQRNESSDFSNTDNIDWFVEGLATYASGQLTNDKIGDIKSALTNKTIPASLDKFWTGNLKYALSGSMVMYLDELYGRVYLKSLLRFNKMQELLNSLKVTEKELIAGWVKFVLQYKIS